MYDNIELPVEITQGTYDELMQLDAKLNVYYKVQRYVEYLSRTPVEQQCSIDGVYSEKTPQEMFVIYLKSKTKSRDFSQSSWRFRDRNIFNDGLPKYHLANRFDDCSVSPLVMRFIQWWEKHCMQLDLDDGRYVLDNIVGEQLEQAIIREELLERKAEQSSEHECRIKCFFIQVAIMSLLAQCGLDIMICQRPFFLKPKTTLTTVYYVSSVFLPATTASVLMCFQDAAELSLSNKNLAKANHLSCVGAMLTQVVLFMLYMYCFRGMDAINYESKTSRELIAGVPTALFLMLMLYSVVKVRQGAFTTSSIESSFVHTFFSECTSSQASDAKSEVSQFSDDGSRDRALDSPIIHYSQGCLVGDYCDG